jgi:hypothetical protein
LSDLPSVDCSSVNASTGAAVPGRVRRGAPLVTAVTLATL